MYYILVSLTMSGNTTSSAKPEFTVRIVVCDHYLSRPIPGIDVIYSDFRGSAIKQVPVLRIFGSTPEGRKACLHVHGVFPYFYIPCPTSNPEPQFLYHIASSLDKAINIALKQASSANQHVYRISLVKGLPFYGYHDKDHLYLKVFLYNPGLIKQAVELCSNGAILGQQFQPHESHLNFTLQFFIDFNLFGMSNIELQSVKFRKSGTTSQYSDDYLQISEETIKPESICYYEADCIASHIINRQKIGRGDGIENPGLEEVWNQEKERRKQLNVSMASKSLSQVRINDETESHYKYEQMLLVKLSELIDKPVSIDNDLSHYPAESMEGSQLFNAVDVSMHVPDITMNQSAELDETLVGDADGTMVDEDLALNSSLSLHYSQVLLNSEDLHLVDLLQDMDSKAVDEDSMMSTPNVEEGEVDDDAEYSQIFNEDTILLEPDKEDVTSSLSWNDSFWDGANITQLDGTCDDDHVKKVRKRKMRPFKLGLSRPKSKKNQKSELKTDDNESSTDEINESRDTIDDISESHLKKSIKVEIPSIVSENSVETNTNYVKIDVIDELANSQGNNDKNHDLGADNESITDLVNKMTVKNELIQPVAEIYDAQKQFEPKAGPSRVQTVMNEFNNSIINDSDESIPEDKGIMSFYDVSKVFDISNNDLNQSLNNTVNKINSDRDKVDCNERLSKTIINKMSTDKDVKVEANHDVTETQIKLYYSEENVILTPKIRPPTSNYISSTLEKYNIPQNKNCEPYYSDYKDVGDKVEIGQVILKLRSKLTQDQKPYERVLDTTSIDEWRQLLFLQNNEIGEETKPEDLKMLLAGNKQCNLEPIKKPPTTQDVIKWLKDNKRSEIKEVNRVEISVTEELDNSQAIGLNEDEINSSISLEVHDKENSNIHETSLQVTMQPDGSFLCFGNSETQKDNSLISPLVEVDFLTTMIIEVLTPVRGELHPDPLIDPIRAVFISIKNDCPKNHFLKQLATEIIVVDDSKDIKYLDRCVFENITYVNTENDLIERVIDLIKTNDPDIMCGYEIEMNSWGYFIERSQVLGLEIVKELSRIVEKNRQKRWRNDENEFEGRIIGRITFNVWRLFRHELALSSYSFENCMYEILKERVPKYSFSQLWKWWSDESRILRWVPVEYYMTRLSGTVRMLEKLDIINRTSELARLFGLQWWEVLSRGSQFRVESLMLRAARPLNLIALSPTVKQRAAMKAPECLPLIFEPESRFYSDPVIVLDFQSLYPSMMIAYNYCFSTCIGRVQNISGDSAYEFGAWRLRIPKSRLETLIKNGLVHFSPVGVGFVKPSVRRGVLPALLRRILAARQAVKKGIKLQTDEGVKKAMHSRQLGLKLIANVTYGYTAANFSGRMPCVEVGDSVVAKGRETLERAIKLVRDNRQWNAKVVYGDTDSMFVLVPGGNRTQAFEIGQQIADAVTADNPSPVALKLEKVYQPCILQTKKRYVGYMYESADQVTPVFEAKGIETVRRDGCPAGVKLLQHSLCSLFSHGDMSLVKRVVMVTLSRLAAGSLPVHELLFTREYHGPGGYRPGAKAPPNEIAKRLLARDRRASPRPGWRVSWLVTCGAPNTPLVRLARSPQELTELPAPPHTHYYAARVLLPPLQRCLSLLGVDVFKWWTELGYTGESKQRIYVGGISRYMRQMRCVSCGLKGAVRCRKCGEDNAVKVLLRKRDREEDIEHLRAICESCCGHSQPRCENHECPVLWHKIATNRRLCEIEDILSHSSA